MIYKKAIWFFIDPSQECMGRDSFRESVRKALTGLTPKRRSGAGRTVSHDAGVSPTIEGVGCVWIAFWQ